MLQSLHAKAGLAPKVVNRMQAVLKKLREREKKAAEKYCAVKG